MLNSNKIIKKDFNINLFYIFNSDNYFSFNKFIFLIVIFNFLFDFFSINNILLNYIYLNLSSFFLFILGILLFFYKYNQINKIYNNILLFSDKNSRIYKLLLVSRNVYQTNIKFCFLIFFYITKILLFINLLFSKYYFVCFCILIIFLINLYFIKIKNINNIYYFICNKLCLFYISDFIFKIYFLFLFYFNNKKDIINKNDYRILSFKILLLILFNDFIFYRLFTFILFIFNLTEFNILYFLNLSIRIFISSYYTKVSDVSADIFGKFFLSKEDDDVNNPIAIADNVGDIIGDYCVSINNKRILSILLFSFCLDFNNYFYIFLLFSFLYHFINFKNNQNILLKNIFYFIIITSILLQYSNLNNILYIFIENFESYNFLNFSLELNNKIFIKISKTCLTIFDKFSDFSSYISFNFISLLKKDNLIIRYDTFILQNLSSFEFLFITYSLIFLLIYCVVKFIFFIYYNNFLKKNFVFYFSYLISITLYLFNLQLISILMNILFLISPLEFNYILLFATEFLFLYLIVFYIKFIFNMFLDIYYLFYKFFYKFIMEKFLLKNNFRFVEKKITNSVVFNFYIFFLIFIKKVIIYVLFFLISIISLFFFIILLCNIFISSLSILMLLFYYISLYIVSDNFLAPIKDTLGSFSEDSRNSIVDDILGNGEAFSDKFFDIIFFIIIMFKILGNLIIKIIKFSELSYALSIEVNRNLSSKLFFINFYFSFYFISLFLIYLYIFYILFDILYSLSYLFIDITNSILNKFNNNKYVLGNIEIDKNNANIPLIIINNKKYLFYYLFVFFKFIFYFFSIINLFVFFYKVKSLIILWMISLIFSKKLVVKSFNDIDFINLKISKIDIFNKLKLRFPSLWKLFSLNSMILKIFLFILLFVFLIGIMSNCFGAFADNNKKFLELWKFEILFIINKSKNNKDLSNILYYKIINPHYCYHCLKNLNFCKIKNTKIQDKKLFNDLSKIINNFDKDHLFKEICKKINFNYIKKVSIELDLLGDLYKDIISVLGISLSLIFLLIYYSYLYYFLYYVLFSLFQ